MTLVTVIEQPPAVHVDEGQRTIQVMLGSPPSSSGAPGDADYLVGTANGTLTNEIVVGATPGGELGGTWASPTVDAVHSGSSHAQVKAFALAMAVAL